MENSRFPIEVCERIIDFLPIVCSSWDERSRAAQACALTCSAWLPRSRYHIYRSVKLTTEARCKVYLSTVVEHPERARWARSLLVHTKEYLPLSQLLAPHASLARYEQLLLRVDWRRYPPQYVDRVLVPLLRGCDSVDSLTICFGYPCIITLSQFLHVLDAMPQLQQLRVFGAAPEVLTWNLVNLDHGRRVGCRKLTKLRILHPSWYSLNQFPPSSLFGTSVTQFAVGIRLLNKLGHVGIHGFTTVPQEAHPMHPYH
ncbi:hypothetical protein C8Q79DRAFT_159998 [Trametes meyenii]|nr:hypothetical protein C8Q79DRAFT_159998 [Trametes meyenii]